MTRQSATTTGFVAILLWSLLALFTVHSTPFPPLMLNALCFSIGGMIGLIWIGYNREFGRLRMIPWYIYAFGTLGLFGYHFLYFSALRLAPAAEAGLIAYLWPLLIVLMSGFLPGEQLKKGHTVGGLIGFSGAALIVVQSMGGFDRAALPGFGLAFLAALTWSGYSVLSRRLDVIPTASVAVFCVLTAMLSTLAHIALETTIWPDTTVSWLSVLALGLGPVGLAFYVWDIGVKKGDIQLLGVASYAAPLLSTLVLILAGIATPSWTLLAAAILITAGAALAARASAK